MSLNKNDIERSLVLLAETREKLQMPPTDLSGMWPDLRLFESTAGYSRATWERIREVEKGKPISFDRVAVQSFAHTRNQHDKTGQFAYFSSATLLYESARPGLDLRKGYFTFNTSENEDGQAGVSRRILHDKNGLEIDFTDDSAFAFREGFDAAMRRLRVERNVRYHQEVA